MTTHELRVGARRPRAAVALGGGGARGYAHIGVLQVLEERGFEITGIAGSSMGALVGGLYAAGGLDAFSAWVCGLTHRDVLRMYDLSPRAPGAIRAERIFGRVSDILGDVRIEDLPLGFTAVATDLEAGEERWLRDGPVDAAIRASAALPGFMTPVVLRGRLLADGGLLNPLPVAATAGCDADVTVAVAVSGQPRTPALRSAPAGVSEPDQGALPRGLRTRDVLGLSLEAMQAAALRHVLADHPPDLLISVPRSSCRVLDFHRAEEMIALGRHLAVDALDADALDSHALDGEDERSPVCAVPGRSQGPISTPRRSAGRRASSG